MSEFEDRYWTSEDGLRLHLRDYPGADERPPVLCLPGLTRNARDFEGLAPRLAGRRRVLCPNLRGRGDSDYAREPMSYGPRTYLGDVEALFEQFGISRCVVIGTSLGGFLAMLLAGRAPQRIAGAVINDIGPEIAEEGLARIRGYVGQGRSFETWMHAARALQDVNGGVFPDFEIADWLVMAKRGMTLGSNGRIVFDYDMKIAEPFARDAGSGGSDMWPLWRALDGRPVLVVRGELSDILDPGVAARMIEAIPGAELATVPRVGHAPTLDEPEAVAAIERLLDRVA
jgi:pimeloyl-ACP methyl ester carboxylesterase